MAQNPKAAAACFPAWFDGKNINEPMFCHTFLLSHLLLFSGDAFFTPQGRMQDDTPLREQIYKELEPYAVSGVPRKIQNIIDLLKIMANAADFPPKEDRIHLANGTLFLDGRFDGNMDEIVRSRLPIAYCPDAPEPAHWLLYLKDLLYEEDIPTFQEYCGYCLLPTNKAQRMMIIGASDFPADSL